jgi:hypothetical protein
MRCHMRPDFEGDCVSRCVGWAKPRPDISSDNQSVMEPMAHGDQIRLS